ncbi:hypothetical protein PHYSODRAFT_303052 [Phytophthora sojae]|uniref:Uncharacterized protein n=1 Tax=Phytophthora sojae (strain P6497) TaxID=1094619 RepID=G4ZUN5_PHYSP|nr:hypothetical protein PHYSODRAFT_303052 [Phytophthora sojae]EGZ13509.1 hypothetical protein PHYSODRAFT_303052 [Phytophthora sojae]|eukprot:XP_009530938.1 hypothetical protein PHYSODRAFT_303052 [Phytophthora sojae]
MGFTSAHLLCNGPLRDGPGLRAVIVVFGSFMLALLFAANAVALVYEAQVASPEFRAKFNDFFCDLRGDEICADEGQVRKVLGMAASSDNTTVKLESVTRVWDYCRAKVLNMAYLQMQPATQLQRGHFSADTHSQSLLKDSFNITDAVHKWCGSKAIGRSVNTTSPSSPVSINPEGYRSLQTQWPDCVKTESIFMGVALVCMAFVCIIDRSGEGKTEQAGDDCKPMKTKMTQEMTTESGRVELIHFYRFLEQQHIIFVLRFGSYGLHYLSVRIF